MKTNPKMRDLADLTARTEAPERLREQIEADAAATRPLDPYAEHAMQIGPTRVFNPKTKGFTLKPAAVCSCGRLSVAATSDLEAELAVQVHALEITVTRLARYVGLDISKPPSPLERAKGGDPSAIAALETRDEILRARLADEHGVDPELVDAIADAVADEDAAIVDEALNGTGTLPPQGIATITARIDADVSHVGDTIDDVPAGGEPIGPGSFEGTWAGAGTDAGEDVLRAEFVERAEALGLDAETLLAEADDLASENPITTDAARERVLADAIRGIGTNGGALTSSSSSTEDTDEPTREAPLEGSLWVCKACDGRNEQAAERCAGCDAEIPESPDYVIPLDPAVAHAMLGEQHPLVRAEKGIRDTNPDARPPAWDAEQILATGGTLPEQDGDA